MMSLSTGSTPSDWAGGPSIRILNKLETFCNCNTKKVKYRFSYLIQRICIALSGFGKPASVVMAISDRAAMLVLS